MKKESHPIYDYPHPSPDYPPGRPGVPIRRRLPKPRLSRILLNLPSGQKPLPNTQLPLPETQVQLNSVLDYRPDQKGT